MRIEDKVLSIPILVLVDSGSTHNFLDKGKSRELGCKMEDIKKQTVIVADGNHIACKHVVKWFGRKFNGHEFKVDVLIVSLGSRDMVLRVQWLSTVASIKWDFKALLMEFVVNGHTIELCEMGQKKLKVRKGNGANPVSIRPYRYPLKQRDVIEQIIDEMLAKDFSKGFIVETDASQKGIGAVLMQNNHPLAFIGPDDELKKLIIQWHHSSLEGGNGEAKYDTSATPGLLQSLLVLEEVLVDISMNFIIGLPKSNNKDIIFVVMDRL
ncbi:hypothetical protein AgCh_010466 [Apium graveolens]